METLRRTRHAALPLLLASALLAGRSEAAPISSRALRDLRIYIQFEGGTGYAGMPGPQAEFRKGAETAMRMWESIYPAMHVTFTSNEAEANITFVVGNYENKLPGTNDCRTPANPKGTGGGPNHPNGWMGCSYRPNASGDVAGGKIYFNTMAPTGTPYLYDRFTDFSREDLYKSYIPATLPPQGYEDPGLAGGMGWIDGQFTARRGGEDATHIVFHEFGHTLDLSHQLENQKPFYGIPYPFGGTPGPTPNVLDGRGYTSPALPERYYGGGERERWWQGDLRPDALPNMHQMVEWTGGDLPGLPTPMNHWFNYRIVRQDLYDYLPRELQDKSIFPHANGLIRMLRSDGSVRLHNNWAHVNVDGQFHLRNQNFPFLVNEIYPQGGQVQKIAVGASHTLAIRSDGSLWAWGFNGKGQLGDGTLTTRTTPIPISPGVKTWVAVAAGESFSLGLRSDNTLWAWGDRTYGQLGDGVTSSSTPVLSPKPVGAAEWAAVKAGPLHAIGLKTDGTLWGWGYNGYGQIGDGSRSNANLPSQEKHRHNDWVAISAGSLHGMAVKVDGTLWTWGGNDKGPLGIGNTQSYDYPVQEVRYKTNWRMPDAGHEHSVGLDKAGHMWTWGSNQFQQLGVHGGTPMDPYARNWIPYGLWMKVVAGHWHTGAIRNDGTLWMWGYNSKGQLGVNAAIGGSIYTPTQEATKSAAWNDLYAGVDHTLAQRDDGTLWGWGRNDFGQLGTGSSSSTPQNSPVPSKWTYRVGTVDFFASGDHFAGSPITLTASTTGDIKRVEFWNGSTRIGTATASPWTYIWSNPPYGSHSVEARAFDGLNAVVTRTQTVVVHEVNILTVTTPAASVSLSTEGTVNWTHYPDNNRKSGHSPLRMTASNGFTMISQPTPVFSWSSGYPSSTGTDVKNAAAMANPMHESGFAVEFPATTTRRTARVYVTAKGWLNTRFDAYVGGYARKHEWNSANGARYIDVSYRTVGNNILYLYFRATSTPGNTYMAVQAATLR